MIALITITLFGLITIWLILFVPIFAPVPTGHLKRGLVFGYINKSRSGYVGKSHLSPKLARSIWRGDRITVPGTRSRCGVWSRVVVTLITSALSPRFISVARRKVVQSHRPSDPSARSLGLLLAVQRSVRKI